MICTSSKRQMVNNMSLDDRFFLLAEIKEVEAILAKIPAENAIERASFEARRDGVRAELERMEEEYRK
jgi:hypothetical protein